MAVSFENLPFDEAIEQSIDRLAMPREQFDELSREAKSQSFTVAWVSAIDVLLAIQAAHETALAEGRTLREFRLELPQMLERKGWGGDRPWHADLVFRQQGMMSFAAGRFRQMQDAGVTHWQYSALLDGRVRPSHAALDGKIFRMTDRRYYPPWEFNCRCVAEPVFDEELPGADVEESNRMVGQQFGTDPETGQPQTFPASGNRFEWDPAQFGGASQRVRGLDLDGVSPSLRTAIETLMRRKGLRPDVEES